MHSKKNKTTNDPYQMKQKLRLILGLLWAYQIVLTGAEKEFIVPSSQYLSFEESSIPTGVYATKGKLEVSKDKRVVGEQSLRWDWCENDSLHINRKPELKHTKRVPGTAFDVEESFVVWIYSEKKHGKDSYLTFNFMEKEEVQCHFKYYLDFTGWRTAWISYKRDMEGDATSKIDKLKIIPPINITSGTVHLDSLTFRVLIDKRFAMSDAQAPYINSGKNQIIKPTEDFYKKKLDTDLVTKAQDLKNISNELGKVTSKSTWNPKDYKALEEQYSQYEFITLPDQSIKASRFIALTVHKKSYFNNIEGGSKSTVTLRNYCELMLKIAKGYHLTKRTKERNHLKSMFLIMTKYLLQSGYQENSSLGSTRLFGYDGRNYIKSHFLMRDALEESGLLQQVSDALNYYIRTYQSLDAEPQPYHMDYFNTQCKSILYCILMESQNDKRAKLLELFLNGISNSLLTDFKENNIFKPDGSLYHHNMHYAGYGLPALKAIIDIYCLVSKTSFAFKQEFYTKLKDIVNKTIIWSQPAYGFMAVGRHPLYGTMNIGELVARLSKSAPNGLDPELASAAISLLPNEKTKQFFNHKERNIASRYQYNNDGFYSYNYAASGIARWKDTIASIKGYNQKVRAHEIYGSDNRYGRYQSHGTIQIFKKNKHDFGGHSYNGWNWSCPPGATTIKMKSQQLQPTNYFYGWTPPQRSPYSGAVNHKNQSGLFVFKLDQKFGKKHDESLSMKKIVVAHKECLYCYGYGINNRSKHLPTVTTLFQNGITSEEQAIVISSSKKIKKFPFDKTYQVDENMYLIDAYGTGYLLPKGNDPVHLYRSVQTSNHDKTKKVTKGKFSTCYILHGESPENSSYEYWINLDATDEKMKKMKSELDTDKKTFNILEKSNVLSVARIKHDHKEITFYSFFSPTETNIGHVINCKSTALIIIEEISDQSISLSISDPSLKEKTIHVELKGLWGLEEMSRSASVDLSTNNTTNLSIHVHDGLSQTITLKKTTTDINSLFLKNLDEN